MISLTGLLIACVLFGVYYFIGKFIAQKITSPGKATYIFYSFVILLITAVILSYLTNIPIVELMGTTEGFYYFAAVLFGAYYGFVSSYKGKNPDNEKSRKHG